jgi:triosephosphate isomerase
MRKKVIAGNWKMYNDLNGSKDLINKLVNGLKKEEYNCEVIICPPFTSLAEAGSLLKGSKIMLGAQNMHEAESGAFTGEISASMIKSTGSQYVILGHSERRTIFKESDELINKKLKAALKSGLKPIFCIGETLEEREKNITNDVLKRQIAVGLEGISESELENIIIAYEPVWAIGTGRTATPAQAEDAHNFIRNLIKDKYSKNAADNIIIQYGGSVKSDNSGELLSQPDIDGALVGGACLKADSFIAIIKSA